MTKLNKTLYKTISCLLILVLFSTFLMAGLLARYISSNSSSDSARVAKWDIDTIDKGGKELSSTKDLTQLESLNFGNYFFEITNNSETAAVVQKDSKVSLELTSATFDNSDNYTNWNFLLNASSEAIVNPVKFELYAYNTSMETLDNHVRYVKVSDIITSTAYNKLTDSEKEKYIEFEAKNRYVLKANVKTKAEYDALSDTNKKDYFETIILPNGSAIQEQRLMSTSTNPSISKISGDKGVSFVLNSPFSSLNMNLNIGDKCTFRLHWYVSDYSATSGSNTQKFKAFYLIKSSEYNTSDYQGLVDLSGAFVSGAEADENTIFNGSYLLSSEKGKSYVLAYKEYDYFEYLIYTSSLGGETMFTTFDFSFDELETRSSGIYKRSYNTLSAEEKNTVRTRTLLKSNTLSNGNSYSNYNDVRKYMEKLDIDSYESYLEAKKTFEDSLGYLGMGLNCNVKFNIVIGQLD